MDRTRRGAGRLFRVSMRGDVRRKSKGAGFELRLNADFLATR